MVFFDRWESTHHPAWFGGYRLGHYMYRMFAEYIFVIDIALSGTVSWLLTIVLWREVWMHKKGMLMNPCSLLILPFNVYRRMNAITAIMQYVYKVYCTMKLNHNNILTTYKESLLLLCRPVYKKNRLRLVAILGYGSFEQWVHYPWLWTW